MVTKKEDWEIEIDISPCWILKAVIIRVGLNQNQEPEILSGSPTRVGPGTPAMIFCFF